MLRIFLPSQGLAQYPGACVVRMMRREARPARPLAEGSAVVLEHGGGSYPWATLSCCPVDVLEERCCVGCCVGSVLFTPAQEPIMIDFKLPKTR